MFGVLIVIAIVAALCGMLGIFGSAMSDAPVEANQTAKTCGIIVLISIATIILCFVARHNGWIV